MYRGTLIRQLAFQQYSVGHKDWHATIKVMKGKSLQQRNSPQQDYQSYLKERVLQTTW